MKEEQGAKKLKNRLKLASMYVKIDGASKAFESKENMGINENEDKDENKEELDKAESLLIVEQQLDSLQEHLHKQNGYKYWIAAIFVILNFIIFFWAVIPLVNYLINNLHNASVLKAALDGSKFIPDNF